MARTSRLNELARLVASNLPEGPVGVALSGGADSGVLAWAVRQSGADTRALFADHHLDHSAALGEAAAAIAASLDLDLAVVDAAVPPGPSLENRARIARYAAIEAAAPVGTLATGHTADDQAETVLGNLLRGAGATGLGGIAQKRGRWIRPLIEVGRAEVRAAAGELGLPFYDDPDNTSLDYRRNVLRHDVLPDLADRFNPDLVGTLNRTAAHLGADDAALSRLAAEIPVVMDGDAVLVPRPVLVTVPRAVAARAVREALRLVHPPYPGTAADVAAVLEVARGAVTADEVSGGFRVTTEGPMVAIYPPHPPDIPTVERLPIPGEARFGEWRIEAEASTRAPRARWQTAIGASADLTIRAVAEGERIDLASGSKLVRDALAEAGVPQRLRSGWPGVYSGARIVWLVGARRAAWATPDAAGAVLLSAERKAP
jgi:tRNA(Ile)-lysidine synthase